MKIETQDQTWKPIVVTIETREEAVELLDMIIMGDLVTLDKCEKLYNVLKDRLK